MHLDIRIPIGLLFIVVGVLLAVFGVLTMFNIGADKAIYASSLDYNINLLWGLVMLAFGAFMFIMGRRGTSAVRTAAESPEGRRLDEEERQRDSRPRGH
jgi:hypothetical protein